MNCINLFRTIYRTFHFYLFLFTFYKHTHTLYVWVLCIELACMCTNIYTYVYITKMWILPSSVCQIRNQKYLSYLDIILKYEIYVVFVFFISFQFYFFVAMSKNTKKKNQPMSMYKDGHSILNKNYLFFVYIFNVLIQ